LTSYGGTTPSHDLFQDKLRHKKLPSTLPDPSLGLRTRAAARNYCMNARISLDGPWEFLYVADGSPLGPAEIRTIEVPGPWQAQFAD
jgi:hypothetical protein